jgi:glycosyltransferase involved in cell wall biosynthesis
MRSALSEGSPRADLKLLILNWRDLRSPRAGGAELLSHEVAKRLVERGHEVTWFTSRPVGLPAVERVDGVDVVRRGSEPTTRLFAPAFARARAFDVLVEQINTLPYFAPLWSQAPVVVHVNQLAREVWWYEAPKPLAVLGWASEPAYLQAYRRTPAITISESTAADLRRLGLRGRIDVIPMAVDTEPVDELRPKRLEGHLVAIGRLAPSKRYDHAIEALALLRASHPNATLTIVGRGRERAALEEHARRLHVGEAVRLAGGLSEADKTKLLTEADVLVGTSAREGWGLTVTEAALRGTPAVVYDVPGFRDSVLDKRTGLLTAPSPQALAMGVRRFLDDAELYERSRRAALENAAALDWERTTDAFEAALAAAT